MTYDTIWKYLLDPDNETTHLIPRGGRIISVQTINDYPYLYVMVGPDEPTESRRFQTYGTGVQIPSRLEMYYVGTYQLAGGMFIGHVFETTKVTL